MRMVNRFIDVPRDGQAIRTRGEQDAVAGPLHLSALGENTGLSSQLIDPPGEVDLLMTGRTGGGNPAIVGACSWRKRDAHDRHRRGCT